jgi:NAD(P)-dependent dehydrogenase (short-subunit alcohol dehydrogenase family)
MSKTILVIGASGTIGSAVAEALSKRRAHVILAGRRQEALSALAGRTAGEVLPLDLADLDGVRAAAAGLRARHPTLHGIVLAAGVFRGRRCQVGRFEEMFLVNVLGPLLLLLELAPLLRASAPSRVVLVGAPARALPDLTDLQSTRSFSAARTFERTRMAALTLTFAFARREAAHGVSAMVCHPGKVRSDLLQEAGWRALTARWGAQPPLAAAEVIADLLLGPGWHERSAAFVHGHQEIDTPAFARDYVQQERLWAACEQLLTPSAAA